MTTPDIDGLVEFHTRMALEAVEHDRDRICDNVHGRTAQALTHLQEENKRLWETMGEAFHEDHGAEVRLAQAEAHAAMLVEALGKIENEPERCGFDTAGSYSKMHVEDASAIMENMSSWAYEALSTTPEQTKAAAEVIQIAREIYRKSLTDSDTKDDETRFLEAVRRMEERPTTGELK